MSDEMHPARRAGLLSQKHVSEANRDAWLDLFAEDAMVADPVGPSPLNPEGKILSLRAFWEFERPTLDADIHPSVGRTR